MAELNIVDIADRKPSGAKAGGSFSVSLTIDNPELLQKWLTIGEDFTREMERTFKGFIFEIHKYLIRVTPIDTGELRGGWTSWLDANSVDYSRQVSDISIAEKAPGRNYHIDPGAVQAGKAFSRYEAPNPLDISIINSVPYGYFLETGTSAIPARNFVEITRFKAEMFHNIIFGNWIDKIYAAEGVVPADAVEEIHA